MSAGMTAFVCLFDHPPKFQRRYKPDNLRQWATEVEDVVATLEEARHLVAEWKRRSVAAGYEIESEETFDLRPGPQRQTCILVSVKHPSTQGRARLRVLAYNHKETKA